MGGPLGHTGVGEMLGQKVEGEAQKTTMMMKMESHMEKPAVALGYCSLHSRVPAEQGTRVVVLSNFGLLGIHNGPHVGMQDKDP